MSDLINLTLVLAESEGMRIGLIAEAAASTPDQPGYGRYVDRDELLKMVRLPEEERRTIVDWVESHGMVVVDSPGTSPQLMFVRATREQVERAFGRELISWLRKDPDHPGARMQLGLPRRLAGYVIKVGGLAGEPGQMGKLISGLAGLDEQRTNASHTTPVFNQPDANSAAQQASDSVVEARSSRAGISTKSTRGQPDVPVGGFTPADIRDIYSFPNEWDGTGETIAILMLGGELDRNDLYCFWQAHGIRPPEIHTVQVGPSAGLPPHQLHTLEAAMSVEWAGAMAPGARIVVYFVDPTIMGDPWAAFLFAVVGDDQFRPTVATMSWVTPERQYYRLHGHQVITGLLAQTAALGITVISAAGDWGPFDGVPRTMRDGRYVGDAPWPHGIFPAVEQKVLAIGGTMITCRNPLTEIAWSGPPPPGFRKGVHFDLLAGSGGFSHEVPIPAWQQPVLRSYYPRGAREPAVVPYGRGFPDVALAAAGPSVQRGPDEPLTMQGYEAVAGGKWLNYAGGTSVAAPIWAAIIARANQARRHVGVSRVGFVNPLLYALATLESSPFRDITAGSSDVAMDALNPQGKAVPYRMSGFDSRHGWDPVSGLGVPHVTHLISRLQKVAG